MAATAGQKTRSAIWDAMIAQDPGAVAWGDGGRRVEGRMGAESQQAILTESFQRAVSERSDLVLAENAKENLASILHRARDRSSTERRGWPLLVTVIAGDGWTAGQGY